MQDPGYRRSVPQRRCGDFSTLRDTPVPQPACHGHIVESFDPRPAAALERDQHANAERDAPPGPRFRNCCQRQLDLSPRVINRVSIDANQERVSRRRGIGECADNVSGVSNRVLVANVQWRSAAADIQSGQGGTRAQGQRPGGEVQIIAVPRLVGIELELVRCVGVEP